MKTLEEINKEIQTCARSLNILQPSDWDFELRVHPKWKKEFEESFYANDRVTLPKPSKGEKPKVVSIRTAMGSVEIKVDRKVTERKGYYIKYVGL